jgi:hypothetical protein
MSEVIHEQAVAPLTDYERCVARGLAQRRYAPESGGRAAEEQPVCHDKKLCAGCAYRAHGFVCWSGHGRCLKECMMMRKESAGYENVLHSRE